MKKFLFTTIIFIICTYISPVLTASVSWLASIVPIEDITASLFEMPQNAQDNPQSLIDLLEATIWTMVIVYAIAPVIIHALACILPVTSRYRDTKISRFSRYIGLCVIIAMLPYLAHIIAFNIHKDYASFFASKLTITVPVLPGYSDIIIEHKTGAAHVYSIDPATEKFNESLSSIEKYKLIFYAISAFSVVIFHVFLFKSSRLFSGMVRFRDEGYHGRGGSARFANLVEEIVQRWRDKSSIFMGNSLFMPWLQIGQKDDRHMLTIAGSRGGKGVTSIIPNLLAWEGSILCTDPKGTNYAVTHKRRRQIGQVHLLDPFEVTGHTTGVFNPLAVIDPQSLTAKDEIEAIAEALIYDSNEKNMHFTNEARAILTGYIAHIITSFPNPDMITVYETIMLYTNAQKDTLHGQMMQNASPLSPVIREIAQRILDGQSSKGAEFYNVMQSLKSQIRFIGSPAIQRVMRGASLKFSDMRNTPVSVYLVLPPNEMKRYAKLQRLIINSAFISIQKGGRSPTPCLMMIDEAESLGYMEEIQKGYAYLAGFNICIWTFWQNKGQLDKLYQDGAGSFVTNSRAVQVFSVSDDTTLDFVSNRLGSRRLMGGLVFGQQAERVPLRENKEIEEEISQEQGICYVIRSGKKVMKLQRVKYFKSWQWYDLADKDPDYPKGRRPAVLYLVDVLKKLHLWGGKLASLVLFAVFIGAVYFGFAKLFGGSGQNFLYIVIFIISLPLIVGIISFLFDLVIGLLDEIDHRCRKT